jgi:hypothetical protein
MGIKSTVRMGVREQISKIGNRDIVEISGGEVPRMSEEQEEEMSD